MSAPQRAPSASPVTPIEPIGSPARHGFDAEGSAQTACHATAFCRVEVAAFSSCGSHRPCNEDAHSDVADGDGHLYVVADGVGGGALAGLASRLLVAELHGALAEHRLDPDRVRQAMLDADRTIARAIAAQTDLPGAATVVLAAPVDAFASRWLIGWVGDCRAYRVAARGAANLALLTRDDTFRALGEAPPRGGSPDDPARMVGNGATTGASVAIYDLESGDLLALCSDGVHRHLGPGDWARLLREPQPLAQAAEALVASARRQGSADDATVLLLRRARLPVLRKPRWIDRLADRRGPEGDAE